MSKDKALLSDSLYSAVLDKIPDMVRVIDKEGSVLYANSVFRSKLGHISGETCLKVPGAAGYCDTCIAVKCIKDEKTYSTTSRAKGRIYSISTRPVAFNDSIYALEIFRDITQEQNLKDKLMANNSRMMNDLEVARSLQLSILRHNLPQVEGYSFCAEFLPCEALGGDMYDCFLARDGRIIMYIADVSGHGVLPAMLTVYLRQEMFAQCKTPGVSPAEVLRNIQNSFEDLNTEESIYITIFVLALEPETGKIVFANAGHSVPPLIAGRKGVRELFLPGTPICRWAGSHVREEMDGCLAKGEKLFLYTDGLDGIHTGYTSNEKLNQILLNRKLKGKNLLEEIKMKFTQTKADDVTMVLCERD
jgi:sigma-B regulation protein RsbU (phosphoserine phosphatase)